MLAEVPIIDLECGLPLCEISETVVSTIPAISLCITLPDSMLLSISVHIS